MKRKILVFFALSLVALLAFSFLLVLPKAHAEACHNTSSYGSVTVSIPELNNQNSRLVWVRMKVPEPSKKVLLQVNESDCLSVSGQDTDSWSWSTYSQDDWPQTISFPEKSGNTIKIIGVDSGVKVDRLLVTSADCTPIGFGTNCQGSIAETPDGSDQATPIQSKTSSPVSGKIVISDTPENNKSNLRQLTYSSSGRVLQKTSQSAPFNTMLLPNGRHTVYVTTELADSTQIREYAEIEVKNSENPFTAAYRWLLLNKNSVTTITVCVLVVLVLVFSSGVFVNYARKRRERNFRGL